MAPPVATPLAAPAPKESLALGDASEGVGELTEGVVAIIPFSRQVCPSPDITGVGPSQLATACMARALPPSCDVAPVRGPLTSVPCARPLSALGLEPMVVKRLDKGGHVV